MGLHAFTANPLVDALVIFSVVVVICLARRIVFTFPIAVKCLFKWKESIQLEYNVKLNRDRNSVYLAVLIPACLLFDRYSPRFPSFMDGFHPYLHLAATSAVFFVYIGLRQIMMRLSRRPRIDRLGYSAATHLFRTVFFVAIPVCLATAGVMTVASCPEETVKTVIFYEIIFFYVLFLLREGQILRHYCSVLSTFLYLCSLETLPALFLVILWIV